MTGNTTSNRSVAATASLSCDTTVLHLAMNPRRVISCALKAPASLRNSSTIARQIRKTEISGASRKFLFRFAARTLTWDEDFGIVHFVVVSVVTPREALKHDFPLPALRWPPRAPQGLKFGSLSNKGITHAIQF